MEMQSEFDKTAAKLNTKINSLEYELKIYVDNEAKLNSLIQKKEEDMKELGNEIKVRLVN
jgi:hypothetical protein